jgi:DNA-binding IclR family transcriptional regulator
VDNALRLLGLFCEQRSIRIAEAGQAIGVARSTALRLMQMLAYHGYVIQDAESRAYVVGPELIRMAVAVVRDLDIRSIAKPVMLEMLDALCETVHLSIRQGPEILFIDSVESRKSLRVGTRTGQKMPAHATAAGKVLLADLDQEHLRALYPEPSLEARTTRTITSRRDLEAQLEAVREQGYAVNVGESEDEVSSVAVPVIDVRKRVRAALAIAAPRVRLDIAEAPAIAQTLRPGAAKVGEILLV